MKVTLLLITGDGKGGDVFSAPQYFCRRFCKTFYGSKTAFATPYSDKQFIGTLTKNRLKHFSDIEEQPLPPFYGLRCFIPADAIKICMESRFFPRI